MDPLTQGLLGATVGQASYGRLLGRRAVVWGALVGMAPDLDVLASPLRPAGDWLWHRGPTHALLFGPLVGPAIGWLLWKRLGGRLGHWIGLCVAALFTHPLLDLFTSYGTQLLWPFSRQRLALDAIAIVDPAYSLVLAAALVLGLRWGAPGSPARASPGSSARARETASARHAASAALALSSAYVLAGLGINARVEAVARRQLAAEGVAASSVSAFPTMLQLPLRRVVAHSGDEVFVGWASGLSEHPISWERFVAASGPLVEAARRTLEVQLLEWFARGEATARVEERGAVVEFDDLRYGVPGRPRDGLWGVRVRLDAAGHPLGAERFHRALPGGASAFLGRLWRRTHRPP